MAVDNRKTKDELKDEVLDKVKTGINVSELKSLLDEMLDGMESVMYYETISGFTGADTGLDSIPTLTKPLGTKILVIVDDKPYPYELISGTTGEYNNVSPIIIHPVDHAAETNEKVWFCTAALIPVKVSFTRAQIILFKASHLDILDGLGSLHYAYIDKSENKNIFGSAAFVAEENKFIYMHYIDDDQHLIDLDKTFIENASGEIIRTISGLGAIPKKNTKIQIGYDGAGELTGGTGCSMEFYVYISVSK